MSQAESFADKPLGYYVTKFQRRVFRRMVEYRVLKDNVAESLPSAAPSTLSLLQLKGVLNVDDFEIKDHIEKACLTGLKAEFELFFTIYCTLVIDHQLRLIEEGHEVPRGMMDLLLKSQKDFFEPFVQAGLSNARSLLVKALIPSHGLGNLAKLLEDCGWGVSEALDSRSDTMPDEFSELIDSPWAQINMAFQVRHAIEHTFSRVQDRRFIYHTTVNNGGCLGRSTWRRWWAEPHLQPAVAREQGLGMMPKPGDRVFLDDYDIRGTAAAMTCAASTLLANWTALQTG